MAGNPKLMRLTAGDIVYVVQPNSFRVDVCKVSEIITRKSVDGGKTQYLVMADDTAQPAPLHSTTLVFKTVSELSRHLHDTAKQNIEKAIEVIEVTRQQRGWVTPTETPTREKTDQ